MRTRFTRRSVCSALILMTVFTMLLSALTFGATTRKKLLKSMKEYNENGTLIYSFNRTFDKNGKVKSSSYYQKMNGQEYSGKSTTKLTYWKGTKVLKKTVEKSGDYTYTYTYNKKGGPITSITQGPDGYYEKTAYKSGGKQPRSSVTVDQNGRKTRETTYDKKGNVKKSTYFSQDGSSNTTTYSIKYNKNGDFAKRTIKWSDGSSLVTTYDKKGNAVKSVSTGSNGNATTTTYKNKYNKEGYLIEAKGYTDGKLMWRDVYKYTSKAYTVDN